MNLPEFSVRRPVAAAMVILVLIVLGAVSVLRLPVDLLPDLVFPMVTIATEYPGVGPEEVERSATRLIEGAVAQVEGLKRLSSTSQSGISLVSAEFTWGTNMDWAAANVREKIDQIPDYFWPDEAKKPIIVKFNPSQIPVAILTVSGEGRDIHEIKRIADDYLKDQLEAVEGVASVSVFAGALRQILVTVDGRRLAAQGIPVELLLEKLRTENLDLGVGRLREGYQDVLVRSLGAFRSTEEIGAVVLATVAGAPVRVRDVATVSDSWGDTLIFGRYNGQPAATVMLLKQSGTNTVLVSRALWRRLGEIAPNLPPGVRVEKSFDQADYIRASIANVFRSTWQGGILAVGVLFLFLMRVRPTLIVTVAIPVSLLVTFFPVWAAGLTLNMMSMGGLALAVGMLVDNAIVVLESIFRRVQELGEERRTAAIRGAGEVAGAIAASTATTIVVFVPILFTTGLAGRLFREMAFTVTVSLAVSLVFALTLVPMLASQLFVRGRGAGAGGAVARGRAAYARALGGALDRPWLVVGGAVLAFLGSLALVVPMGKEFIPEEHDDLFMVNVRLPRGTRVEVTNEAALRLEAALRGMPEIRGVHAIVGIAQGAAPGVDILDPEYAFFLVRTTREVAEAKGVVGVIDRVRAAAAGIPQIERFSALSLASATSGTQEKPLAVRIYGRELDVLERLSRQAKAAISGVPGVRDVEETLASGSPELQLRFDREALARLGLSVGQVAGTVETYLKGRTAAYYRDRGDEVDIVVRLGPGERGSAAALAGVPVILPGRPPLALADVARLEPALGPGKVLREDQRRKAEVTANLAGRSIDAVVRDVRAAMAAVPMPEGYFVEYAGSYQDMVEALTSLAWAFLLALLLIYMVMAAQFESLVHPFAIMFTVPFSLIGVILALYATGTTLSVNSFIGVVILAGVVVNNGIVLVDRANQLRAAGRDRRAAILEAGESRLRPVLMTAATTMLGVIPMYLTGGSGAELRRPLALTLGAGLLFGTVLTLLVLPVVYAGVDAAGARVGGVLRRVIRRGEA